MGRAKRKSITQASIEAFVGAGAAAVAEDVQFKVPFLPLTAPVEPTPAAFRIPLYEHQQRSLHRMLQIEARDESVAHFNFGMLDYYSTGGCLADAIGMGKTATMLALIAGEPRDYAAGANLLVAPSHLLAQWKLEVDKFVKRGEIDVVLGLRQYMELVENPAARADISNRMLVLVGVEEAVKSRHHLYRYGQVFPVEMTNLRGKIKPLPVEPIQMQEYEEAAKFVHKAYCGPLWITPLHLPHKPWRRVVFEEVQDLVLPGKAARDCFIQLTHRCMNVWLITATPFPGKVESMYANNQLLGFKRLRLLPNDPAFDEIKRKLYLRNCAQVKQQAITDKIKVDETYIPVKLHPKELIMYRFERVLAAKQSEFDLFALGDVDVLAAGGKEGSTDTVAPEEPLFSSTGLQSPWSKQYKTARQCCVHVGISDRILERERGGKQAGSTAPPLVKVKSPSEVYRDETYHLNRQLAVAKKRKNEVEVMEAATRNTVEICRAIRLNTYASVKDCFGDMEGAGLSKFFNETGETTAGFRMLYKHYPFGDDMPEPTELLFYHESEIEDYILKYFNTMDKVEKLAKTMETTLNERCPRARAVVEEQLNQVTECVAFINSKAAQEGEALAAMPAYGSKISALVQYLSRLPSIKVVVFTMWDQALRVVDKAIRLANITSAVFLQHQSSETKSAHVASFHSGDIQVLILNSLTSASGINLQVASHVLFLDPVGFSPMQASTLEQQAIGRVLRMGQTNEVVAVVRFVAEGTMEAALYDDIHEATTKAVAADDTFFDGEREDAYVCADFAAPVRRVVRMFASADDGAPAEDEEIQIEGAMSIEQAITHRLEQAEAEGEVFDLTEDAPVDLEQQLAVARAHDAIQQPRKRRRGGPSNEAPSVAVAYAEALVKDEPQRARR
jgi:superfamily II DNA or RNA helicase